MNTIVWAHKLIDFIILSNYILFYYINLCDNPENIEINCIPTVPGFSGFQIG